MNKLKIVSMKSSVLILFFVLLTETAFAQLFYSAVPLLTQSTNTKTISLSNSNVAATGFLGDYHINPASIGIDSTFQLRPRIKTYALDAKLASIDLGLKSNKSPFSLSVKKLDTGGMYAMAFGTPLLISRYRSDDLFLNATYGYSFNDRLKAGIGINYLKMSRFNSMYYQNENSGYYKGFSLDLGLIYQQQLYESETFNLRSGLGFSLTDFGNNAKNWRYYRDSHLPTTLRIGGNISFETKNRILNQSLVKVDVMSGVSKIMARMPPKITGSDTTLVPMKPFKALFKSWDTIEYFNGREVLESKLSEQLWFQIGLQLTLLETLSLRFGFEDAPKMENVLDKVTFGVGLDIYYLSIDYSYLKYINDYRAGFYGYEYGHNLQLTGRIPLDGYRPDSILDGLFK